VLPLFEAERIRGQGDVPALGQLQRVELLRVPAEARRFALPQVVLPVVLVDAEDRGMPALARSTSAGVI
jgi:hypothetical protein